MKKKSIFNIYTFIVITLIYIVLMFVGSKYDLNIANSIYDPNNKYGEIISHIGILPSTLLASFGGVLFVLGDQKKKKVFTYIRRIFFVGCTIFAAYYIYDNAKDVGISTIGLIIEELLIIVVDVITFRIFKDKDKEMLTSVAFFIVSVVAAETIVINYGIKLLFPRPRPRFVLNGHLDCFRNAFTRSGDLKEYYLALGEIKDNFKSFPSGHTASATCLIVLSSLSLLFPKLNNNGAIIFVIGIMIGAFVAYGRMLSGAHFLSDVATGAYATVFASFISKIVYFDLLNKKLEELYACEKSN